VKSFGSLVKKTRAHFAGLTNTRKGKNSRYSMEITDQNLELIVATGRARWKVENENNNVLKNRGYHLEHNFGHGKEHLSSLLAAMNILAFLYHVFLDFCDEKYRLIRAALPTRQTFFDDLRALTRYFLFADWDALMDFMMRGLEIGPFAVQKS
jgi:hypothetical protein